jgi:hypothetical protein
LKRIPPLALSKPIPSPLATTAHRTVTGASAANALASPSGVTVDPTAAGRNVFDTHDPQQSESNAEGGGADR